MNFFDLPKQNTTKECQIKHKLPESQNHIKLVRIGQLIRIKRLDGGKYNYFKGYIGEIKDYRKGQNTALIVLHALNTPQCYKIPLDHFDTLN